MRASLLSLICLATCLGMARGSDWPCFRGPNADGISPERGINKEWNQRTPKTLWTIPLTDNGYAAPAVSKGRLYIVDHREKDDVVRALDAATGKDLWQFTYPDAEKNRNGFTVSTPLVLGDKVYIYSRKGKIHCLNASTGEKLWARDLINEYAPMPPPWDICMSPVVDDQALILGVSGTSDKITDSAPVSGTNVGVVTLDKDTGKLLWENKEFRVSFASPVIATLHGRKQYLIFGVDGLYSLDPANGKIFWRVPWPSKFGGKKGPTPLLLGDRIFVATTEGGEAGVIDLSSGAPVVVWKNNQLQDHFPSPIHYHGRIYGPSDPKFLVCLDPADGKVLWKQECGQYASVLGIDDTVIALSGDKGALIQIDATTPEYKELGRCTPLGEGGGKSWAAPIVAEGRLYIRNQKELACIDLK